MVDGTLWQGTRPCPPHMGAAGAVYRGRGLEDRHARGGGLRGLEGKTEEGGKDCGEAVSIMCRRLGG